MTLATTVVRVDCPGNSSAVVFSFAPIPIYSADDLVVTKRDANGVETVITRGTGASNYAVGVSSFPSTGSITYPASGGSPLATGETLVIVRRLDLLQTVNLENQGGYFPETQETEYDRLTAMLQQIQEQVDRCLKIGQTDTGSVQLPTKPYRANQLLGFDSNGVATPAQPSAALVSSAMQPVVAAATLGDAMTAFGIASAMRPFVGAATTQAGVALLNTASAKTHASVRDLRGKLDDFCSLGDFGGVGDNSTDNSSAFNNAFADLTTAGGGGLFLAPGTYLLVTGQVIPANVTIWANPGTVTIKGMTGGMVMFGKSDVSRTHSNNNFIGITFDGGVANVTALGYTFGWGIRVENCTFTGIKYTGVFDRCWNVHFLNNWVRGNAVRAAGQLMFENTTGANYGESGLSVISNMYHDLTQTFGIGGAQISPLISINNTEVMAIQNCEAFGLDTISPNSIIHIGLYGVCQGLLLAHNSSVGASIGIYLEGSAITAANAPSYIRMIGNDVDTFGTAGIKIYGASAAQMNMFQIIGGHLTAPAAGAPGLDLVNIGFDVHVSGVTFYQWLGYPVKSGIGVRMTACQSINVSGCYFSQLTTAVSLVGGANAFIKVNNNRIQAVTNTISGTGARVDFTGNMMDALPAPTLPTLPASSAAWVNDTGYDFYITVIGGTVSNIVLNGTATGNTGGNFLIKAGGQNSIIPVYTVAPTWVAIPLG